MQIPEQVKEMFGKGVLIYLATVDEDCMPNVVPMLQYWWFNEDTMVIGDLYMKTTKANVQARSMACISACGEGEGAYKLKGTATYETTGPAYNFANDHLHKNKPDRNYNGVVVFKVTQVYNIKSGPDAGKLMAGA